MSYSTWATVWPVGDQGVGAPSFSRQVRCLTRLMPVRSRLLKHHM